MTNLANLQDKSKNLSLLYVEDDIDTRTQFITMLEVLFKNLSVAVDGQDALKKYKEKKFDLIITDINMPNMDGIELIKNIRQINKDQRIIIVSAYNNSSYFIDAISLNVDSFILKPIDPEQFYNAISKSFETFMAQKLFHRYQEELEEQVVSKTKELANSLVIDKLTGLRNRKAMFMELEKSLFNTSMLININRFEHINVIYGFHVGDQLLKKLSEFLQYETQQIKVKLFYIGMDEFALFFYKNDIESVKKIAYDLHTKILKHKFQVEKYNLKVSLSFAITEGSEEFLKKAHIALRDAKKDNKQFNMATYNKNSFTEAYQRKVKKVLPLIEYAIENKTIVPYFQPIVDSQNATINKYEALARIIDKEGNIVQPYEFIKIAESTGTIPEITKIMIDKTFAAISKHETDISINISEYDLQENYLEDYLTNKLKEHGIDPSRVVLEVLEGISSHSIDNEVAQLKRLKSMGFMLALDDFGAENSNFERVHALDVDFIKIDGKFIKDIDNNTISFNVAKSISDFAHSIGAKVIAEYVHSQDVLECIQKLGIEFSQGYHFSEPKESIK